MHGYQINDDTLILIYHEIHIAKLKTNTYQSIIGVVRGHGSRSFRSQFIELDGCDTLVEPSTDFPRDKNRIAMLDVEPVTQLLHPGRDLFKLQRFLAPVPFHHMHFVTAKRGTLRMNFCDLFDGSVKSFLEYIGDMPCGTLIDNV